MRLLLALAALAGVLLPRLVDATAFVPAAAAPSRPEVPRLRTQALTPTELRYGLVEQFGAPFYCDPDEYPVAHQVSADEVRQRLAALAATSPDLVSGILAHYRFPDLAALTDDQARQVYADAKMLPTITLEPDEDRYQFRLRLPGVGTAGILIAGFIDPMGNVDAFTSQPDRQSCPRCLAGDTLIDTPLGPVAVKDLRPGLPVWTADAAGKRQLAHVAETHTERVTGPHALLDLTLDDGRHLRVSPGHPTAGGDPLGKLAPGNRLDGARVLAVERVPLQDGATYDLLPTGATGLYWANGILLGSTLHPALVTR
jgi:hypothetical protein